MEREAHVAASLCQPRRGRVDLLIFLLVETGHQLRKAERTTDRVVSVSSWKLVRLMVLSTSCRLANRNGSERGGPTDHRRILFVGVCVCVFLFRGFPRRGWGVGGLNWTHFQSPAEEIRNWHRPQRPTPSQSQTGPRQEMLSVSSSGYTTFQPLCSLPNLVLFLPSITARFSSRTLPSRRAIYGFFLSTFHRNSMNEWMHEWISPSR